ncbi:exopolysaccharide biosynthesis protein [Amaricoccus macauensis]|uniref:exopolysaccharide biosynthesis protein n=1 Tax=Amaricoccus macauensis TaxID=57001 RepID=UPI003C7C5DCC
MAQQQPLEDIVGDLRGASNDQDISVGKLVEAFDDRPAGVVVTLLAFLALIPVIGGLPGAPVVIALLILTMLIKPYFGGGGIWVPGFIAKRKIPAEKLEKGLDAAEPWAKWIDGLTSERLRFIVAGQVPRSIVFGLVALLAIALVPLGLIPAGITPAALGILVFGLALVVQDGLFAIIGYAFSAASAYMLFQFL